MKTTLAIIPARGGSKGLPQKNIRILAGKPLIAWTIETARNCNTIDRLIVSTDDPKLAQVSYDYGAEIPFIRPAPLAQDDTPDLPVFQHALNWLGDNERYYPEIVIWLRPTSPLRTVQDINAAIQLFIDTGADCVRSICTAEHHPYWMKRLDGNRLFPFIDGIDDNQFYRRQMLPPVYRLNGAVEVIKIENVIRTGSLYNGDIHGYVMPLERSLDIDSEVDLALAELILGRRES